MNILKSLGSYLRAGRGYSHGHGLDYHYSNGWETIFEPFTGAWQRNIELKREDLLCQNAVFTCITLISSDIAKLPLKTVVNKDGIWADKNQETNIIKLLDKPNDYQNRIQFFESWIISKLSRGNTFIYKERDVTGKVVGLHVLNPCLCLPLVSPDGERFYQLQQDNLCGLSELGLIVHADDIIHDRFNCLYHPLVGISPLFAAGLPALLAHRGLDNSAKHFTNGARPSGILTVPQAITPEQALKAKTDWKEMHTGKNTGNIAVLSGDMKYQPIAMNAQDSQLIQLLKYTSEAIASVFKVPAYKVTGENPTYSNIEALDQAYYSQCLQVLLESIEMLLNEHLNPDNREWIEFDISALLRMDSKTQIEALVAASKGGIMTPNEARRRLNLKPLDGGDTIYMQHQDYPLEQVANRTDLIASEPEKIIVESDPEVKEFDYSFVVNAIKEIKLNA